MTLLLFCVFGAVPTEELEITVLLSLDLQSESVLRWAQLYFTADLLASILMWLITIFWYCNTCIYSLITGTSYLTGRGVCHWKEVSFLLCHVISRNSIITLCETGITAQWNNHYCTMKPSYHYTVKHLLLRCATQSYLHCEHKHRHAIQRNHHSTMKHNHHYSVQYNHPYTVTTTIAMLSNVISQKSTSVR